MSEDYSSANYDAPASNDQAFACEQAVSHMDQPSEHHNHHHEGHFEHQPSNDHQSNNHEHGHGHGHHHQHPSFQDQATVINNDDGGDGPSYDAPDIPEGDDEEKEKRRKRQEKEKKDRERQSKATIISLRLIFKNLIINYWIDNNRPPSRPSSAAHRPPSSSGRPPSSSQNRPSSSAANVRPPSASKRPGSRNQEHHGEHNHPHHKGVSLLISLCL